MIPQTLVSLVRQHLLQLEKEKNICILFAADAGSRSYGWSSLHSDFDIHMIYCHHSSHYLTIQPIDTNIEISKIVSIPKRDLLLLQQRQEQQQQQKQGHELQVQWSKEDTVLVKHQTEDDSYEDKDTKSTMIEIELNIVGYELKNFLALFGKSNPAMVHMLHTPVLYHHYVRQHDTSFDFAKQVQELCHQDVSRRVIVQSLLDLARKNIQKYIVRLNESKEVTRGTSAATPSVTSVRVKVYLYLLHHLFYIGYIYRRHKQYRNQTPLPPLQFELLMNDAPVSDTVRSIIAHLLRLKRDSVGGDEVFVPRYIELELFIFMTWKVYYRFAFSMDRHFMKLDQLDQLFRQCLKLTDRELIEE